MGRRAAALAVAVILAGCSGTSSTDGAVIYTRTCATCHGADLGGGVGAALGAGTAAAGLSDAQLRAIIRDGVPGMPPSRSLSEEQLDALIAFLRQEQGL